METHTGVSSPWPAEALAWLTADLSAAPGRPLAVVVIGLPDVARACEESGADVHRLDSPTLLGAAHFDDASLDLVVLDAEPPSLREVVRVLRPGGRLALVETRRDHRIPWARKLDRALGATPSEDPGAWMVTSEAIGFVESDEHRYWQLVTRDNLEPVIRALPELKDRDEAELERVLTDVRALYADYGRGADGMQLPWLSRSFRATVSESAREAMAEQARQEALEEEVRRKAEAMRLEAADNEARRFAEEAPNTTGRSPEADPEADTAAATDTATASGTGERSDAEDAREQSDRTDPAAAAVPESTAHFWNRGTTTAAAASQAFAERSPSEGVPHDPTRPTQQSPVRSTPDLPAETPAEPAGSPAEPAGPPAEPAGPAAPDSDPFEDTVATPVIREELGSDRPRKAPPMPRPDPVTPRRPHRPRPDEDPEHPSAIFDLEVGPTDTRKVRQPGRGQGVGQGKGRRKGDGPQDGGSPDDLLIDFD